MTALIQIENDICTAQIADACMRLKINWQAAPSGIKPVTPLRKMVCGPVIPVRHYGSVDVFLEALESSPGKGILTIDNGGRQDEACIGDLIVLETKNAGLQGIVVWGLHRDTSDLIEIGLPVFTYGAYPAGPNRLDKQEPEALTNARFGNCSVDKRHTAFADHDGVIFVESTHLDRILDLARTIRETERKQSKATAQGLSLRQQFQFREFLKLRESTDGYTFRKHLSSISKAIEE